MSEDEKADLIKLKIEKYVETCFPSFKGDSAESDTRLNGPLVSVDVMNVFKRDPELGNELMMNPITVLAIFEETISSLSVKKYTESSSLGVLPTSEQTFVSFVNIPVTPRTIFRQLPGVRATNRLIMFSGIAVRVGVSQVLETTVTMRCRRCGSEVKVDADPLQGYKLDIPLFCVKATCHSTVFTKVAATHTMDYQEIRVQESTDSIPPGTMPNSLPMILLGPLVDTVRAGGKVAVTGILLNRWDPLQYGGRCQLNPILRALSVKAASPVEEISKEVWGLSTQLNVQTTMSISMLERNSMLDALLPTLYGCMELKLAVALALIGGNGSDERRSTIHLLIVGDSGTGKSASLRAAASHSHRAVLTSGSSTSRAGLTAAAKREGDGFTLDAGALVMADSGICCLDEFHVLKPYDRPAVYEAMENGRISFAKAGIVCTLNANTTVIAAAAPKGGVYDVTKSVTENVGMADPLLSRFDIVIVLGDTGEGGEWDSAVADFVLEEVCSSSGGSTGTGSAEQAMRNRRKEAAIQLHIARAKSIKPTLEQEAKDLIVRFFSHKRRENAESDTGRTTIRLLESLLRISEAHAKLMLRGTVTTADAVIAIHLSQTHKISALHVPSEDPDEEHENIEASIFNELGMGTTYGSSSDEDIAFYE